MSNVCGISSCGFGTMRAAEKCLASDVPMYREQSRKFRHLLSFTLFMQKFPPFAVISDTFCLILLFFAEVPVGIDHFLGTKADLEDLGIKA